MDFLASSDFLKLAGALIIAVITGIVTFFAGRGQSQAAVQTAFNETAKMLLQQIAKERDDCHKDLAQMRMELDKVRGDLANSQQNIYSMSNHLRRLGIDIPKFKHAEPIFVLNSKEDTDA